MSETSELKNILEAALLGAGELLSIDRMLSMFPVDSRPSREAVREALKTLEQEYQHRGIELKQFDRGYRFQTRQKYAEWILRLHQERPPRYSRALLETLAIVAYKQPVTRGDIEAIRGVSVSTEIMRTLLEREWIRQVGYRDAPGRPALYGTTRQFVEHFDLSSIDELPPLAELRDLEEIGKELGFQLAIQTETSVETRPENVGGQNVSTRERLPATDTQTDQAQTSETEDLHEPTLATRSEGA